MKSDAQAQIGIARLKKIQKTVDTQAQLKRPISQAIFLLQTFPFLPHLAVLHSPALYN